MLLLSLFRACRWGWVKQTVRRGAISGPGASALATGVDPRFETRGIN
jgi:hypothetical protein